MNSIDLGETIESLLGNSAHENRAAFEAHVGALSAKIQSHRIVSGPTLPDISTQLDSDQRQMIASASRTIRLLAPAGAGKTHCIVNKVLALLRDGADPKRILLVTFDNNSANELRGRLGELLGSAASPIVSTLNAYGLRLLRSNKWAGQAPQLLDGETRAFQQRLLKELLDEVVKKDSRVSEALPENVKRTFYLDIFSYLKNQLYSPRDPGGPQAVKRLSDKLTPISTTSAAPLFSKTGGDQRLLVVLLAAVDWIYRRYDEEKESAGYMDFDDQKLLAFELLRDNDVVRGSIQRQNAYVIVDEFQDLNELDFRLIMTAAEQSSLIVVGDDDQAIYGFRGTSPAYMIDLPKLAALEVETITLDRNYRSPENIVRHATRLIRNNTYRIDKNPKAVRTDQSDIRVYSAVSPSAEAALIGAFIQRVVNSQGSDARLDEIAVLYRMNAQALPVQLDLLSRNIPYYCRKQDDILGQDYLPRLIALLRAADAFGAGRQPTLDDFLESVRAYFRYARPNELDLLRDLARRTRTITIDLLDHSSLAQTKIVNSNLSATLRELATKREPVDALLFISKRFRGVHGLVGSLEEALNQQIPLGELTDIALRFETLTEFADFLEDAIRRSRTTRQDDYQSNSVRLLTYFRSKGLQFDTVILPSVNQGIIPHSLASIEDERRLFYVAVTRTRKNLWLSYVRRICNKAVDVSPFLKELELPRECWVNDATPKQAQGVRREEAAADQ